MIVDLITELGPWAWWILGLLLLILEIFVSGTFLLWIGVAALIVGTNALIFPMPWQLQIGLFAILSVVLVLLGRRYFAKSSAETDRPHLNERAQALVGRTFTLSEALSNREGRLKIGDTFWMVRSDEDLAVGEQVAVTGVEGGSILLIARA